CGETVLQIDDRTAILVDRVVIADNPKPEAVARIDQKLATREPAIALVGAVPRSEITEEAVTLVHSRRETERKRIGNRAGHVSPKEELVVIAIRSLGRAAEFELRFPRGDRYDTRRRVLPEQGRLRPTQNLDPLDVGQVGDLRGRTRAIDVVDEHAD